MTMRDVDSRPLVDDIDLRIIVLLEEDARRSYGFIGRRVFLSPSAVKRRIDSLRACKALLGFTAVVEEDEEPDGGSEAFLFLSMRPELTREDLVASLLRQPEIVRAWMVSGESDAIAHVRVADAETLGRLIEVLREGGLIERLRSESVLSGGRRADPGLVEGLLPSPARALLSS